MAKTISCFFCRSVVPRADVRAKSVLCSTCVSKLVGSPQAIGKFPKPPVVKVKKAKTAKKVAVKKVSASSGWGRGWHLKKSFTAPDGTKYSFGQPIKKGKK